MLSLEDLTKKFGELVAVDGVSLTIEEGEIHSIIGPNGAGKTTLFNLITGDLPVTSGRVRFKGDDITGLETYELARRGIGRSFQVTEIFDDLTIFDNVLAGVQMEADDEYSLFRNRGEYSDNIERTEEIIELLELQEFRDQKASSLSHGDERKLEIGIALGIDPDLLLLDEPAAGLSQDDSEGVIEVIELVNEQCTVVLVEHDIDIVMSVSDRVSVLHQGELLMTGTPDGVSADERVNEAYLGAEI